ncbi:MAG TPA: glycosyltransferase family 1 protein [Acidimicrobiales bacterium]|nr:glycosyltransferase family 1 protein [Acidimicrobiales bacterium]
MQVAVHVGQLLQGVPGGIGRYVRQLVAALPGAGVGAVTFAAGERPAGLAGPYVRLRGPGGALRYEAWARLRHPVPQVAGAVVHAPSLAVPPPGRRPLVVTVHDLAFLRHPDALTPRGVSFHRRGLALARREAAAIIVPTAAVGAELEAEGFEPGRVHVAHHGDHLADGGEALDADTRRARLDRLDRLGVSQPFVLFVGTLEPRKGVADLVAAHAQARRRCPDLQLVLAGPRGWGDPPDLQRPGVVALGPTRDGDLDALYGAAVALALPSRYEGFGLPVLEAMSRGCPVVASDIASLAEVAGGAALLVPVGDVDALAAALERLAGDPGERHRRSAAGRDRSAAFSWAASARAHAGVYRVALDGAPMGGP